MEEKEFQNFCKRGLCLRKTIKSRKCETEIKQKRCFQKWKNKEKDNTDEKWEKVRCKVWYRDAGFFPDSPKRKDWKRYCRLWGVLTLEEKSILEQRFKDNYVQKYIAEDLDVAHKKGKGSNHEEKYNPDNCYLISRIFHSMLDEYKNPITLKSITKEERYAWFDKMGEN